MIVFILASNADPDEMSPYVAFLGSSLFAKVPVYCYLEWKGYKDLDVFFYFDLMRAPNSSMVWVVPNIFEGMVVYWFACDVDAESHLAKLNFICQLGSHCHKLVQGKTVLM